MVLLAATRPPFTLFFDELEVGDCLDTEPRVITLEDIEHFAHFTGDLFYAHMDDEAAKASPIFEGRVAHGYLVLSMAAGLFVWPDPGPVLANYGVDNLRFATPTYPGPRSGSSSPASRSPSGRAPATARSGGTPRSSIRTTTCSPATTS